MDFYSQVPKDRVKNLQHRLKLNQRALKDRGFQRALMHACKEDVLFFFNAFCWLYEPRPMIVNGKKMPMTIPFVTWCHQDPVIRGIKDALGHKDIGIEKSRGEGMSWMGVMFAVHDWIFTPGSKVGFVSSTMDKAHKAGDMDSLLEKAYWEIKKLPDWMTGLEDESGRDMSCDWQIKIAEHIIHHRGRNSLISAAAAVGGAGRGGRYTWYLMDELSEWDRGPDDRVMASTQQATNSRLVVATPLGNEGAYYKFMHAPSNAAKFELDWKMNPTRNRGLYKLEHGKPVPCDPSNPLPKHYNPPTKEIRDLFARLTSKGFRLNKGFRSPWYDRECDRADSTPQSIAQELDRDYGGSMVRLFQADFFEVAEKSACDPIIRGEMKIDDDLNATFLEQSDGPMKLWMPLDSKGEPRKHQYVVGADIATGIGGSFSSNSVIQVIDLINREQVMEYAVNTMEPGDFADTAIAICQWLGNAYLIWETNGVGQAFTKRVKEQRYSNLYRMRSLTKTTKDKTKNIGWVTSAGSKNLLFSDFIMEVRTGGVKIHSRDLIRECGQYIRDAGKIVYLMSADDKALGGEEHGDRAMSFGMAVQAMKDRPLFHDDKTSTPEHEVPYGSLAWRQQQWAEEDSMQAEEQEMEFWELLERGNGALSLQ